MKPEYTVVIYTPQELNHASYVQTGLFECAQNNMIKIEVVLSLKTPKGRYVVNNDKVEKTNQTNPKVSFYKLINNSTKKSVSFACDLYDHANQFSVHAFNHCDYIFKRSYEERFVGVLPEESQNKIYKLGLCFGVRSVHSKKSMSKFYWGLMLSNLMLRISPSRGLFSGLWKSYKAQKKHWKFILTTRLLNRFETFTIPNNETVFFQTRCFKHEKDPDVKAIHQQRYHIIKLLKKEFPNHFQGGFVPSNLANQKYSDALSNVPSEPEKYLNALKQAKIVIYTRGLANSPAWKMAEYLSQAKVIIAEKLTTDLPVPLIHGKEVLWFETDEELINNINKVMHDNELANSLSNNARAYFEEHVHPTKNIKRILELMISKTK